MTSKDVQLHMSVHNTILYRQHPAHSLKNGHNILFSTKKSVLFSPHFSIFHPLTKIFAPRYFAQACSSLMHTFIINNI